MTVGALALLLSFQTAQVTRPSATVTPPPTIIRLEATPFCQTFRENVFHALQGLRINDLVIDQGQGVLAKWAYDSVVRGGGVKMDQYQLGQIVGQAAHNLQRVYGLLNDQDRFPTRPQTSGDAELIAMKARLEAVADAQERSLNLLSGTYETAALYALLSLGDNTAGVLGTASVGDKTLELGDPVFTSPGFSPPPTAAAQAHTSLFGSTPIGRISTAVTISERITGNVEDRVTDAVTPGVNRCRGT